MSEVKKYDYIDSLRGIAILLVIAVHTAHHIPTLDSYAAFIAAKGQYGVQLFFIASALTLFLSFNQRIQLDQGNTVRFFLIRRFFRIAPAYYIAIIIYSIYKVIMPWQTYPNPVNIGNVIMSVFFINGFFPGAINYIPPGGWSVAIEMIFYLLIPFFYAHIKSLRNSVLYFVLTIAFAVACNLAGGYIMQHYTNLDYAYHQEWYFYFWLPNQLPVFMLGMFLFHLLKNDNTINKATAITLVLISVAAIFAAINIIRPYNNPNIPEHLIVAIFFTVIIYAMSKQRISILQNGITKALGMVSFSMYIWHFIILDIVRFIVKRVVLTSPGIQYWVLFLVATACTFLVSSISYKRIELAGTKLGKKLIAKIEGQPAIKKSEVVM